MKKRGLLCVALLAALAAGQDLRFRPVDVFVECGDRALAAWQVEVTAPEGARLVGVEGFPETPHYDPAALEKGRVVIASFTLGEAGKGRVCVARLHFMETGAPGAYRAGVIAAAVPGGAKFAATAEAVGG